MPVTLQVGSSVLIQSPHPHNVFVNNSNFTSVVVTSGDKPVVQAVALPKNDNGIQ